MFVLTVIELMK